MSATAVTATLVGGAVMIRRRATRLAATAAVFALMVPLRSHAAEVACTTIRDASGDAHAAASPAPDRASLGSLDRVDITSAGLSFDDGILTGVIGLRSLAAQPARGEVDTYDLSWRDGDGAFTLEARHAPAGWTFSGSIVRGATRSGRSISGSVDAGRGTVMLAMPEGRDLRSGDLLTGVRVGAHDGAGNETASAPGQHADQASGPDLVLDSGCASPLQASGERCGLLGDAPGDNAGTPVADDADPSIDVRAVRAGTNAAALVLEVDVASVRPAPDGVDAQRWTVSWQLGADAYHADATRTANDVAFSWTTPDGTANDTRGSIASNSVTIVVPRLPLALADGAQISGIVAHAADLAQAVEVQSDDAPDDAEMAASYAAGVPCARQLVQLCPIVTDPADDAGPIVTYDGRSIPQNQDALDILSIGADTTAASIVVSLRVADIAAAPPAGYDTVGYTVSWHRSDGRRFYAEAYRSGSVATFEYGIDPTPDDGPSGAVFSGVATTGSFDAESNVIRIVVPRSVVAGSRLLRYGASAWTVLSGDTLATQKGVDATRLGSYRLGIACSA